jgi:hypothetical protein
MPKLSALLSRLANGFMAAIVRAGRGQSATVYRTVEGIAYKSTGAAPAMV